MPLANFLPDRNVDYVRILPEIDPDPGGRADHVHGGVSARRIGEDATSRPLAILALFLAGALGAAVMATVARARVPGHADRSTAWRRSSASLVIGVGLLPYSAPRNICAAKSQPGGEYYALILFSIVGQCVMVTAQ